MKELVELKYIGIAKSTIEWQLSRNDYKFNNKLNKFVSKENDEVMMTVIIKNNNYRYSIYLSLRRLKK